MAWVLHSNDNWTHHGHRSGAVPLGLKQANQIAGGIS